MQQRRSATKAEFGSVRVRGRRGCVGVCAFKETGKMGEDHGLGRTRRQSCQSDPKPVGREGVL